MKQQHGGQILIDQLKIQGTNRVFCIPGESYLAALDGLYQSGIDVIVGRHEGGVAMMAAAHGRLTGKPGIAFVTRGPGATNASAGVHVAYQNSIPMILFIGQVGTDMLDREAFQEINYQDMFGSVAKWVAQVNQIHRIPEYISRAFHTAMSGRPGPVVLALPEDMLSSVAENISPCLPAHSIQPELSDETAYYVAERISHARHPLIIAGGGVWSQEANDSLVTFAESFDLPVALSFRRQDYFDNTHKNYVGDVGIGINPELAKMIKTSDLLIVLGARLGEMPTSGYTHINIPNPEKPMIHVHPDPNELGKVYRPELAINASPLSFLKKLSHFSPERILWTEWRKTGRENYEHWSSPVETPGNVKLEQIVCYLRDNLPGNAIITNGAGNYAGWLNRYFRYQKFGSQLAPTSGSMGYGLPAAIAAKLERPSSVVICFAGDGCFQMTSQEFATAIQHDAHIIVIVCNNSQYGTIRMHQEKTYPGRTSGTLITNPDFTMLAKAYGGYGEKVSKTSDFPAALERAENSGKPAIIELILDQDAISSAVKLSDLN